jgi:hypothetical protein
VHRGTHIKMRGGLLFATLGPHFPMPQTWGSTGQRWTHVHGLTNVGSVLGK